MTTSVRSAAVLAVSVALAVAGCTEATNPAANSGVTELQIQDLRVGTGAEAAAGKTLDVRYSGWLYDSGRPDNKGAQFDAGTFSFVLGSGAVIRGFDQGFAGMKVGGQRRLTIPGSLAYGPAGSGPIPPNATLIFDVELLGVR